MMIKQKDTKYERMDFVFMVKFIMKRDGRTVPFDASKITDAVRKAINSIGKDDITTPVKVTENVVFKILQKYGEKETPTVEEIQDLVEKTLIEMNLADVAKEYILYRAERTRVRDMNSSLMLTYNDLTFSAAKDSNLKRENANINADTAMGTMLKYGSEGAKKFNELYVLKPEHSKAHINGDIHIHDLDYLTLTETCCQIDLLKLFHNGFSTGHGHLREPNGIAVYSALACIAIQSNQNDQHGGQSVPNFEYAMAEGVKKTFKTKFYQNLEKCLEMKFDLIELGISIKDKINELKSSLERKGVIPQLGMSDFDIDVITTIIFNEMIVPMISVFGKTTPTSVSIKDTVKNALKYAEKETDRETYQAMEALIHNLNTMNSRAGAQVPFSSINYGLDTSPEGRMVIKNVLLAEEAGLGMGETPIFPIHIFKVKEGINYNKEDPNYDLFKLACRVSAKRLFPNFSFIDAPFNLQYYKPGDYNTEIAYMGCRTRVIGNVYDPEREIVTGRGNLSFTSINLPRLAIKANHDVDKFFDSLDEMLDLVVDQLLDRLRIQSEKTVRNYPFLMGQGVWIDSDKLKPDDKIGEILKHGTLSIGFIGLAECLKALVGKHHGEDEEARKLGYKIIQFMRDRMDEESENRKLNFSLLATPAEGLSGRFVRIDKKIFGEIEGITDRDYYTNSFHVPVYYNIGAFDKIKIEAPFHAMTNAGHISYIELDGDPCNNLDAFEKIVRCMKESGIGYGSINHPVDRDPVCGYTGIIGDECPQCHRHDFDDGIQFERIRRITGYLVGTLDRFNDAKLAEVKDRVKHNTTNNQ